MITKDISIKKPLITIYRNFGKLMENARLIHHQNYSKLVINL
jgi:hypothetical protein